MVRLAGIGPTTPWFVAKYSIQLSYSRILKKEILAREFPTPLKSELTRHLPSWSQGLGRLLARNSDQFHFKLKGGIGWNHTTCTTHTVGNGRWTGQFGLAPHFHQLDAFGPTGDDTI